MMTVDRRRFLGLGALAGALGAGIPEFAFGAQAARAATDADDRTVYMTGDGLNLTPAQYSRLLSRLADERGVAPDNYILGGVVDELEAQFARILGKERAVFMPTGTLANQLAVRVLAGGSSRAVVQAESHLYMDSGDCVQTLSNITLMGLAPGRATFTADELIRVLNETRGGRVVPRVSVIQIETPVRRRQGEVFNAAEMAAVIAVAQREGIRLHLDGARLFLEASYAGRNITAYTAPFDTVYVSLWKYFNSGVGAILAGPKRVLDDMFHARRMFGGNLWAGWPAALVARHYMDGFVDRLRSAVRVSEDFYAAIARHPKVSVERIPHGTNLARLTLKGADAPAVSKRLAERGIRMPGPAPTGVVTLGVNETWNRITSADLARAFEQALE